jgi:hypothetical protein
MTGSREQGTLSDAEVRKIRERLTSTSRKLSGMETSLKAMKERHELVLRELRLSSKQERENAQTEGGVISQIMDYIMDIKDILEMMKTTIQEVYGNENRIAEGFIKFEETNIRTQEKFFTRMESYRILAQLGELDSKILTLKFNGIPIDQTIPNKIMKLRSSILTEKDISIEDLQQSSIDLFRMFAESIEHAIDNMSYKPETKEILESMREVSWM